MKLIVGLVSLCLLSSLNAAGISERTKYKMFRSGCARIGSTSQDYIVIKVKNVKTAIIKEICTTPQALAWAIFLETGGKKLSIDCKKNETRYFEFSQDIALSHIGFDDYSRAELLNLQENTNIDSIVRAIKRGSMTRVDYRRQQLLYFAHLMFDRGVITTTGCFGTDVAYFKRVFKDRGKEAKRYRRL